MVCVAGAGCATPNYVAYSPVNAPPRPFRRRTPAEVDVFLSGPALRPHADVGLFDVWQGSYNDDSGRSTQEMVESLRLHAALRGCDAVQLTTVEGPQYRRRGVMHAVCEMYTDAAASRPPASVPPPAPLSGEGQSCVVRAGGPMGGSAEGPCPDPLVCRSGVCASPYQ
jgi:hypothetical protein